MRCGARLGCGMTKLIVGECFAWSGSQKKRTRECSESDVVVCER